MYVKLCLENRKKQESLMDLLVVVYTRVNCIFGSWDGKWIQVGHTEIVCWRFWYIVQVMSVTCSLYTFFPCGASTLFLVMASLYRASRSHSDTPHSLGLLWTSDQPDAEASIWQHPTLTRDRHPCARRNSNPQSQQARSRRPTICSLCILCNT
jgi:hypothetical protein